MGFWKDVWTQQIDSIHVCRDREKVVGEIAGTIARGGTPHEGIHRLYRCSVCGRERSAFISALFAMDTQPEYLKHILKRNGMMEASE